MYATMLFLFEEDSVKQEIFKRLDTVAEKLGVAAQHLWEVLVRQGRAEAIADAVITVVLLIVIGLLFKNGRALFAKGMALDEKRTNHYSEDGAVWYIGGAIMQIAAGIMVVPVLIFLHGAIMGLYNPEFKAIQMVLEAMHGGH